MLKNKTWMFEIWTSVHFPGNGNS